MIYNEIKDKTVEALYCIYKKVCERAENIHSVRGYYALGDTLEPIKDEDKRGGPKEGIFGVASGIQVLISCEKLLGIGSTDLPYNLAKWLISQYLNQDSDQNKQENFRKIVKLSNTVTALGSLGLRGKDCAKAIKNSLEALHRIAWDTGGWSFWEKDFESKDAPDIVPTCHALLALKKTNSTTLACYRKGLKWLLTELAKPIVERQRKIVAIATLVELGVSVKAIPEVKKFLDMLSSEITTFQGDFFFGYSNGWAQLSKPVCLLKPFLLYSPEEGLSNDNVNRLYKECLNNVIVNGSYREGTEELHVKHLELVKIFANVLKFEPNPTRLIASTITQHISQESTGTYQSSCVIRQSYQSVISVSRKLRQLVISTPGIIDNFLLTQFQNHTKRVIFGLIVLVVFLLYQGGFIPKKWWDFFNELPRLWP